MKSIRAQLRYRFDNLMSKGLVSLIGLLSLVTVIFVIVMTLLVMATASYPVAGESFNVVSEMLDD